MVGSSEPARPRSLNSDETIKETGEAIIIALILAFVFRAFVVEAFIIPTGSMAPTLLGAHSTLDCPSCGYEFDAVTQRSQKAGQVVPQDITASCPMCRFPIAVDPSSRVRTGDRILVDKFTYCFVEPSRWDVIVFKNPEAENSDHTPGPQTNFIKRLVGLPGEQLHLLDGNVFVAEDGDGEFGITRKTDAVANTHWERIQRSIWQPIYHSQYVPVEDARSAVDGGDTLRTAPENGWSVPWQVLSESTPGSWRLGSARTPRRSYAFAGGQGVIGFAFDAPDSDASYANAYAVYPYNRYRGDRGDLLYRVREPIEDIRLALTLVPEGEDVLISLSTTTRLDRPSAGTEHVTATVDSNGWIVLTATDEHGETRELPGRTQGPPLRQGRPTQIELWVVDHEVSVWIDGERIANYPYDLTWQQVLSRPAPDALPDVRIAINSQEPVELYRVELDRDIYYSVSGDSGSALGGIQRRHNGNLDVGVPVSLANDEPGKDDQFFVMGDNTPESQDARYWRSVDPWIQQRHLGGEFKIGAVPRSLLVGRAVFVYYPSPHAPFQGGDAIIPNFGRMRFIH